jgi:hypothetical protein
MVINVRRNNQMRTLAVILALTLGMAAARAADPSPTKEDFELACARKHLQDGEVAETPEQQAGYDACIKRTRSAWTANASAFKPWQRVWQCNDIRVTETVNQPGIVNYDLGGTIWGGSQFALDIQRGNLYFNGRPCLPLR